MEMRIKCEKCSTKLKENGVAYICSYECTYCEACAGKMNFICPNCQGELVIRPKRIQKT